MRTFLLQVIRIVPWMAPTCLALLPLVPEMSPPVRYGLGALLLLFSLPAAAAASDQYSFPGALSINGLRAFVPERRRLDQLVFAKILRARSSVKILDSWLGNFDSYRAALKQALTNSARLEIRILIAKRNGHFAAVRGTAVPGLEVNERLPDTIRAIRQFKDTLQDLHFRERVVTKDFDAIVPGPIIIVDDHHVFLGTFLQHPEGSPASPALWLQRGRFRKATAVCSFIDTFDRLWNQDDGKNLVP